MESKSKKNIMLLVSNSINKPDLLSGNDLLVQSLRGLGYDVEIVVFSQFYNLISKLKSDEPDLVFNLFERLFGIDIGPVGVLPEFLINPSG